MIITWHGEGAVKIQIKEVTVAINPHDGSTGKMPKFAAQIALMGMPEATLEPIKENPFIIKNPGEFEVKGVFVYGIENGLGSGNSVFMLEGEGVKVGYLGGFTADTLNEEQMEKLEGVDILLLPVGGDGTLNSKQAIKVINQVEPRIVIPIQYKAEGYKSKLDTVDQFLKEYGATKAEHIDKLKITKKELPSEDTKVYIVTPS